MAVGVCVWSTLNVQYWAWETQVGFTRKECRGGAPSCSWPGSVWTLAYCQNPWARSLLVRGTENLWLAAMQVKCMWSELNGLITPTFE